MRDNFKRCGHIWTNFQIDSTWRTEETTQHPTILGRAPGLGLVFNTCIASLTVWLSDQIWQGKL